MLKLKLVRQGKRGQPSYRIAVMEARSKLNGKTIAEIGFYDPKTNPPTVKADKKTYQEWLAKGAQPTPTVAQIFKKLA